MLVVGICLGNLADVKELLRHFRLQVHGFAIVEAQFESMMSFKKTVKEYVDIETLFDILDNDQDGRIDGLELLGGLALCCQASFEEKARFCFEIYDFNMNSSMAKKEMTMMLLTTIGGINLLTGGGDELEPDIETVERITDEAFEYADRDGSGQISYEEFVLWARSSRDLMAAIESLNKIASDAKQEVTSDDSAPETDEGELSEVDMFSEFADNIGPSLSFEENSNCIHLSKTHKWKNQIYEPTNFNMKKLDYDGPDTNLELCWAFGYGKGRSNLRYVVSEVGRKSQKVVYFTAVLAIVYDLKFKEQSFYVHHKKEVRCLAVHPKGGIVATGDTDGSIHIWSADTLASIRLIKGIVKQGVQHIAFSSAGDHIAAVVSFNDDRLKGEFFTQYIPFLTHMVGNGSRSYLSDL